LDKEFLFCFQRKRPAWRERRACPIAYSGLCHPVRVNAREDGAVIQSLIPILNRQILFNLLQPRCLTVCATAVRGSAGTFAKFNEDLARARELWACAGVNLQYGGFQLVDDSTLLDLTKWDVNTVPDDAKRLLAMGPNCGRAERPPTTPTVFAYYVRTLGGGYNGIGRPTFANDRPGLVLSDAAGPYTFAHEIGHILGLGHVPNTQTDNVMYFDSPNITSDPPVVTDEQCRLARMSTIPMTCTSPIEMPIMRVPRPVRRPPFENTPALVGLLSDDPGVVERFAAMGEAILPQLLMRVNDPDIAVRQRVLAVLARIGTPMALQALATALQSDANPSVRATAATALAETGSPLVSAVVNRALQDVDPGVRAAVIRSLGSMPLVAARMGLALAAVREVNPAVRQLAARVAMAAMLQ
jgi:hypothetical protein